jgi:acetate---CoA ligase (ADP-forming)
MGEDDGFGPFVEARSIAVVGASERNIIARITLDNLGERGFPGRVFGIHPRGEPVDGVPTFPSYEDAGGPPDLAVLAVGAPRLVEALRTAADAGVRSFVVPGAGSNEGGPAVWPDLRAAIEETNVRAIGPNCMGFAAIHERVVPYVGSIDPDLQPGGVALVSQSGSVLEMFTALPWRVGFSHVISVGNELGVDMTAALEFLVDDPSTSAIGLFIEGIRRPADFRAALERAAGVGKPVVALKVGRSEVARAGAASHTGALAGDQRVFSAVVRDGGGIEVSDLEEMLAVLEVLGKRFERAPGTVVYVGDSGGEANLFADLADRAGVELPQLRPETRGALAERFPPLDPVQNPLDLWAIGVPEETYRDGVALVVEHEPHAVVLGLDKFLARAEPERVFVRAGVEGVRTPGAMILMAYAGSDQGDLDILRLCWDRRIPVVRGAGPLLAALASLDRWHRWRRQPLSDAPAITPPDDALVAGAPGSEHAAKALLAAAGIEVTREREVATAEEAVRAARDLGFPVVAKTVGGAHKSETRGVRLDLATEEAVAEAVADLLERSETVLVSEQVRGDAELIAGAFLDEQFGPCGLVGLGGVWTEALGEAVAIAGPGSAGRVRRALEAYGWGRLLLRGARGRTFPVDAIADVVLRLIALVGTVDGRLEAIEINPLVVAGDRVVAVDALAVPGATR